MYTIVYNDWGDETLVASAEVDKSKARYDRLVELTLKILGLHTLPEEYLEYSSPWVALIETWQQYAEELQCMNVIFSTLHRLMWGTYPIFEGHPLGGALHRGTPHEREMCELLTVFEDELTSPGVGMAEIKAFNFYVTAFYHLCESPWSQTSPMLESESSYHQKFVVTRFLALACPFGSTDLSGDPSLPDYKKIKEAIETILPTASTWSDVQWCDEIFILTQIDKVYRTSYAQDPYQFNGLVDLATAAKNGNTNPGFTLDSMQELPFDLIQHLWPNNLAVVIENLYRATYCKAQHNEHLAESRKGKKLLPEEFGFAALKETGIQRLAEQAVSEELITDKEFRTLVFNVRMGF